MSESGVSVLSAEERPQSQSNSVRTSSSLITGGCAAVSAVVKDVLFYSIDSYKVVKQAGQQVKLSNLFRGTVPIALLGSGPSFGVFFLFYHPIRDTLSSSLGTGSESASVLLASALSSVPSSIVGVPADVLKKQLILGSIESSSIVTNTSVHHNIRSIGTHIVKTQGIRGLFLGWKVNVMRDMPYAAMKMSLYEGLARLYITWKHNNTTTVAPSTATGNRTDGVDKLQGVEAAVMGLASGVITAAITCPIDCVNTRIKSGELAQYNMVRAHMEIVRKDGVSALFRGVVPRCAILGLGSTVFWYVQASLLQLLEERST